MKKEEKAAKTVKAAQALRKQAEKIARDKTKQAPLDITKMSPAQIKRTLHELRVHQIELNIQNEELQRSQEELNASRERYFDLYDLAPVAYLTVSEKGLILEANLTAATLLGVTRRAISKKLLSDFIIQEDQTIYYSHRKEILEHARAGKPQTCELRMIKKDGTAFWAHLETTAAEDAKGAPVSRTIISNISLEIRREFAESVINTVREPLIVLDQNLRVLSAGRSFYELFKAKPAETEGQFFYKLGHKQWNIPRLRQMLEALLAQNTAFENYEVQYDFATIGRRTMLLNARQIPGVLGKEQVILLAIEDITARKQAEMDLRKSEERFRAIADYTYDWESWIGTDGKLIWVNSAVLPFTGYSVDECLAMTDFPFPIIAPDDHEAVRLRLATFVPGSSGNDVEFRIRCKDGSLKWGALAWQPIYDAAGVDMGMRSSIRDITERRKQREALRQATAYNRSLIEASLDPLVTIGPDGKITDVNKATENATGYPRLRLIGTDFASYFEVPTRAQEGYQQVFRDGFVRDFELALCHKNGSLTPVIYNASLYRNEEGEVVGVFAMARDITERKKTEEQLSLARIAAEEANRAKSAFLANMSHEIRTPMNAILGFGQVLESDPSLTPQQAEHVRTINHSGEYLLRLIDDILDISKIEIGQITLHETNFCLHDLLDDLGIMFRSRVGEKGLQFMQERDDSVPRNVTADEGKLRQVLINLLGNAAKFTATGGIAMRVRADAVAGKTDAVNLIVEVEDTGPGITEAEIGTIFGAFQQAAIGVKAGGTGLGLAISRKFAEMMGGELTVSSHVDKGSCFRLKVLLKPAAYIDMPEKPASRRIIGLEHGTETLRLLVVDDASANRALLCALLRPMGFEVAEAVNGVEALEIFANWYPHAVLMDMRMPVMDGYEATRRIKATEVGRATAVIAITASAFDDDREQVIATGVDGYLRKPFRVQELLETIGKCLHLHYVYAEEGDKISDRKEPAALGPAALIALPQEIIKAMRLAVEEGDIAHLTKLISQVKEIDRATALGLQALTDRYDYARLRTLLWGEEVPDNE